MVTNLSSYSGVVCEWVFAVAHDIQKQVSPVKQKETPLHDLSSQQERDCNSLPSGSFDKPEEKSCEFCLQCEKSVTGEVTNPHNENESQLAELSMWAFVMCAFNLHVVHDAERNSCSLAILNYHLNGTRPSQFTMVHFALHHLSIDACHNSVQCKDRLGSFLGVPLCCVLASGHERITEFCVL